MSRLGRLRTEYQPVLRQCQFLTHEQLHIYARQTRGRTVVAAEDKIDE